MNRAERRRLGKSATVAASGCRPDEFTASGFAALSAGRIGDACDLFAQALSVSPGHGQALHGLGLALKHRGDFAGAIRHLEKAVASQPEDQSARLNLGSLYYESGRFAEALACFEAVRRRSPRSPLVLRNVAMALLSLGRTAAARDLLAAALTIAPADVELLVQFGYASRTLGDLAPAIAAFSRALALDIRHAGAAFNLGCAFLDTEQFDQAEALFRQVLAVDQTNPGAMMNLAAALLGQAQLAEALGLLNSAKSLAPSDPQILVMLGWTYRLQGALEDAEMALQEAIRLDPDYAAAWVNFSVIAQDRGEFAEAFRRLRQVLDHAPDHPHAGVAEAYLTLASGDLQRGWQQLERRLDLPVNRYRPRHGRRWLGDDLAGSSILVHAEEGFGDTLQFARYLPMLATRARQTALRVPRPLLTLCEQSLPGITVLADDAPPPSSDFAIELLSLPLRFATGLESIPATIPYLKADPEDVRRWRDRLGPPDRLKVGVVWAGNPRQRNDCNRSMPIDSLLPLIGLSGVDLFSLQTGPRSGDLDRLPRGSVIDLAPHLKDFAQTAAALESMDIIVSVCTSVAHLAGALGRPGVVMLSTAPCWRWLRERGDTPWYPTLQLLRQQSPRDWAPVVSRVVEILREQVDQKRG